MFIFGGLFLESSINGNNNKIWNPGLEQFRVARNSFTEFYYF